MVIKLLVFSKVILRHTKQITWTKAITALWLPDIIFRRCRGVGHQFNWTLCLFILIFISFGVTVIISFCHSACIPCVECSQFASLNLFFFRIALTIPNCGNWIQLDVIISSWLVDISLLCRRNQYSNSKCAIALCMLYSFWRCHVNSEICGRWNRI